MLRKNQSTPQTQSSRGYLALKLLDEGCGLGRAAPLGWTCTGFSTAGKISWCKVLGGHCFLAIGRLRPRSRYTLYAIMCPLTAFRDGLAGLGDDKHSHATYDLQALMVMLLLLLLMMMMTTMMMMMTMMMMTMMMTMMMRMMRRMMMPMMLMRRMTLMTDGCGDDDTLCPAHLRLGCRTL